MKKRIRIEFDKRPLDFTTRKAFIEVYKASKGGEKAYFQERLFDYPYYLRFWVGKLLIGFRGIESRKLGVSKQQQTMIELGESFMLPGYDDKDLLTRITLKVLWSFWKEQFFGFESSSTSKNPKLKSTRNFLLLSKEMRTSKNHFYTESLPGLASSSLEKITCLDTWTALKLFFYNCKENCKGLFRPSPLKTSSFPLFNHSFADF
ncbi:MAG: hypothetical protein AAFN10_07325 [Bacteroidota bacterium]